MQNHKSISRRAFLGLTLGSIASSFGLSALTAKNSVAATLKTGGKVLIVYYSRTGNTEFLAHSIHNAIESDIIQLHTVKPYPEEYKATTQQAKKELESGFHPPLATKIQNMDSYDCIILGSPCWWGTIASPVISFLSDYDFTGKSIAPFMTHGGSGLGRSISHIQGLCPTARVLDGLAVWGNDVSTAQNEAATWLRSIGLV